MTFPTILTKEVEDPYAQENFKRIGDFFTADALTRSGFEFVTVTYTAAVTNSSVVHRLGYVPKDVILMHNSTNATVTFSYNSFTSTAIVITVSAATTLRMLVGRYV